MKPSDALIDFVAGCEGCRLTAYKPLPTDRWTIGYGSTFIEDKPVVEFQTISAEQARAALAEVLDKFAISLTKVGLPSGLTQEQFDAVLSLVYNIGFNRFMNSDTGALFYGGQDISDRFELYTKSGGKVITGLVRRRIREKEIYVNGIYA